MGNTPDLTDGNIHYWEHNGVKFAFVSLFGWNKMQYVAPEGAFHFKAELIDEATKLIFSPNISDETFTEFYAKLEAYKNIGEK
jgi:hypothetical protein